MANSSWFGTYRSTKSPPRKCSASSKNGSSEFLVPFKSANPVFLHSYQQQTCQDGIDSIVARDTATDRPGQGQPTSPQRGRTMRDYDRELTDLRKENFSLKLRIYLQEERMQSSARPDDLAQANIELKMELELLKKDLSEKQELLVKASKALEAVEGQHKNEAAQLRHQHEADKRSMDKRLREMERELAFLHEREQRRRRRSSDHIPPEVFAQALQQLENPSKKEMMELTQQVQELEDIVQRLNQDLKESQGKVQDLEDNLQEKERQGKIHEENTVKRDKTIQGLLETVYNRSQEITRLKERLEQRDGEVKSLKEELNNAYKAFKVKRHVRLKT